MNDPLKDFLFIDQLKIMGYGESDTSGCWIKFQLTPELLEVVRGRKGEMVEVAAKLIDNAGEIIPVSKPNKGEYGKYWQKIIAYGTFNAPQVLGAVGSDAAYRGWITHQPSALSGKNDWDEDAGEGRCVAAHVRRVAAGSGTGIKPDYSCIPLTDAEHREQHQKGEPDRELFERKANQYRLEWASNTLAKQLGYDRRSECPGEKVAKWAEEHDLTRFFPVERDTQ